MKETSACTLPDVLSTTQIFTDTLNCICLGVLNNASTALRVKLVTTELPGRHPDVNKTGLIPLSLILGQIFPFSFFSVSKVFSIVN